jgi:hypothetical protein
LDWRSQCGMRCTTQDVMRHGGTRSILGSRAKNPLRRGCSCCESARKCRLRVWKRAKVPRRKSAKVQCGVETREERMEKGKTRRRRGSDLKKRQSRKRQVYHLPLGDDGAWQLSTPRCPRYPGRMLVSPFSATCYGGNSSQDGHGLD